MQLLQQLFKENTAPLPALDKRVFFYATLLIAFGIRLTWNVEHHLDLVFFDETEYLYKGMRLSIERFNDWGPAYNVWYYALSFFKSSAVDLYYFNYKVIITILPVLLFLFLYVYGANVHVSLLMAISYLMLNMHTANFTLVSHFCLLCMLCGFIAARIAGKNEHRLIALLTASYICMYARQEFLVNVIFLLGLWIWCVIREKKIRLSIWHLALLTSMTGLYFLFGFISFQGQGIDRSYFAFIQHFYINYSLWAKKALSLDQFIELDLFKGSKTMLQCMLANPELFAKHAATNIGTYFVSLFKYIEDFILPKPVFHYLGKGKHILFGLLLIGFAYQVLYKKVYRHIVAFVRENSLLTLVILLFFGWSFFSLFMIFPNRHYMVIQFWWYMLLLGLMLKENPGWFGNRIVMAGMLIVLFICLPASKPGTFYQSGNYDRDKQPNLLAVQYLNKHNTQKPLVILTAAKGFYAYLPTNYKELFPLKEDIAPYFDGKTFDSEKFLADKKIDIIYMNERLQGLADLSMGNAGKDLSLDPGKYGFKKVPLGKDLKSYLLVKM